MLGRRGPVKSIIRAFPYLGRGCIVILAAVAIITSELSVSTTSSTSVVSPTHVVDRTTKGDRLPLIPALPVKPTEQIGFRDRALPVGCEAVGSLLARSRSAHIARRCLS
jgi:hypothetical protein